jgi:hypothetical protein
MAIPQTCRGHPGTDTPVPWTIEEECDCCGPRYDVELWRLGFSLTWPTPKSCQPFGGVTGISGVGSSIW